MSEATGHIELERNIDGIVVGVRHRKDLGDIDSLMRSIGVCPESGVSGGFHLGR